jgi:hypothetical protein
MRTGWILKASVSKGKNPQLIERLYEEIIERSMGLVQKQDNRPIFAR